MSMIFTISGIARDIRPAGVNVFGPVTVGTPTIDSETLVIPALASGDNTINVPLGAIGCLILTGTTIGLKFRTSLNAGDVGTPISGGAPSLFSFPTVAPTTIILTAASIFLTSTTVIFF